jgi:phosphate uptake regulator
MQQPRFWMPTERGTADPENAPSYLDLIFVGRALERIGDHATHRFAMGGTSLMHDPARNVCFLHETLLSSSGTLLRESAN